MSGLILPTSLTNSNDDYVEELRGYLYPKLHPYLVKYTPAYGVGTVGKQQYVGAVGGPEEVIEQELTDLGFVRNPIACYKSHPDGRESEGSWVLIAERDEYGLLPSDDRQLHLTLFSRRDGRRGRELYAHEEFDWRDRPFAHLRGKRLQKQAAVQDIKHLLENYSFLTLSQ